MMPTQRLSEAAREYVERESYLRYEITAEPDGYPYRVTSPRVRAEQQLLVVGDSVAFGIGVDDAATLPSAVQGLVGERYQVLNAAMPGYGTDENLAVVEHHRDRGIAHLVYLLCKNDLEQQGDAVEEVLAVLRRLAAYRTSYGSITVVLHAFVWDVTPHLLAPERADELLDFSAQVARSAEVELAGTGLLLVDWAELARQHARESKTPFANVALYADDCHFSPAGNLLLARALVEARLR